MKKVYNFDTQLKIGKTAEEAVKKWLTHEYSYIITEVDLEQQLKGIDFIIGNTSHEVKLDNYCQKNGRYFLEVQLPNKDGWVHTCSADKLYLVVGGTWDVKIVDPKALRYWIPIWKNRYGVRTCENKNGYWSQGVCVPLNIIPGKLVNIKEFAS